MKKIWAALALLAAPAACVAVLGIEDGKSAVERMCGCDEVQALYANDKSICEEKLGGKFEGASDEVRAAWMHAFDAQKCDKCDHALGCLGLAPACSRDACEIDEQCCFGDAGAHCSDAGKCVKP